MISYRNMNELVILYKCAVVAAVLLLASVNGLETPQGFPTVDSIRIRASRLNTLPSQLPDFTQYPDTQQALYPTIRFTCSVNINRIRFIGRRVSSTSTTDDGINTANTPSFQTWRQASGDDESSLGDYVQVNVVQSVQVPVDGPGIGMFEVSVEKQPSGMRFEAGEILGSRAGTPPPDSTTNPRITLLYLPNTGGDVTLASIPTSSGMRVPTQTFFRMEETVDSMPLIAVESDSPGCVQGALQMSVLNSLVTRMVPYVRQIRVVPELNFTCSVSFLSIFIGANLVRPASTVTDHTDLQLVIWNCTELSNCERLYSATIRREELSLVGPSVYKADFNYSLIVTEARAKYVFGIEQPTDAGVLVQYQQDIGPTNYNKEYSQVNTIQYTNFTQSQALPLIHPEYQGGDSCSGGGFIGLETLRERALLIQPIFTPPISSGSRKRRQSSTNGYQYLFISSPFQTSGSLSSFVFAANQSQIGGQYPQFQIWRCNGDNELMQVFETPNGPAPLPSGLNLHQYIAEFDYMAGDFVGLFQPYAEKSALVVAFQMLDDVLNTPGSFRIPSDMPLSTYTYEESDSSQEELNYTPLVTVVMDPTTPMSSSGAVDVLQACVPNIVPITSTTSSVTKSSSQETDPTSTNEPPPTVSRTSTAPDNTSNTGNTVGSQLNVITIAGSAVGAVIGLLLVMVMVLVVFILALKCKKKKDKFEMSSVENPQYSAGGGGQNGTHFATDSYATNYNSYAQDYATPISTRSEDTAIYQTIGQLEAPQPYEAPSVSMALANQMTAGEYEVPSVTKATTNESGRVYQIIEPENPTGIYHTLEPTVLQNTQGNGRPAAEEIEMSVIVPTGDQRENLKEANERDVYASLKMVQSITSNSTNASFFEETDVYWRPAASRSQIYEQLASRKYREIPRPKIRIMEEIGSGNFGDVHKGVWEMIGESRLVAIKTLKHGANSTDAVMFLQEAAVNGQFRHPNVVKLYGVVTVGEPVMIVLELMENGDLLSYLKNHFTGSVLPDWPHLLLGYCRHIAAGMDYLSKKGFVHRDLAARNVLVSADGTCKITDFGMSREIEEFYVAKGGVVPVKWTAPEALNYKTFSTASDVWSFGCVMYEIWSLGHKPFQKNRNIDVLKLVEEGYRLPPPPGCPREVYSVMIQCWHPEAHSRPPFMEVLASLLRPVEELLIMEEAYADSPRAANLGAPLKHSKNLHLDLQNIYKRTYENTD